MTILPLRLVQERALYSVAVSATVGNPVPPFRGVFALHFPGPPDVDALEAALNAVIARHAGLRAAIGLNPQVSRDARQRCLNTFARTGLGVPQLFVQTIESAVTVKIVRDGRTCATDTDIVRAIERDLTDPFDFATPPALRARLLSLAGGEHLLLVAVSHVVVDRWSIGILQKELIHLYRVCRDSTPSALRDVQLHQPAFAAWEHDCLAGGGFNRSLSYWKDVWSAYAGDQLRHHELGATRTIAPSLSGVPALKELPLDAEASSRVRSFCRESRCTPYVWFRASLAIALHQLTGRTRLAVGGNFSNRVRPHTDSVVGWLNNRHLLRIDVTPDATGRELIDTGRAATAEAIAHHSVPLPALWHSVGQPLERPDLVSATFDYLSEGRLPDAGVDVAPFPTKRIGAASEWVDLAVRIIDTPEGFLLRVVYSVHRYPASSIRAFLETLQRCALRLLERPDTRISTYS